MKTWKCMLPHYAYFCSYLCSDKEVVVCEKKLVAFFSFGWAQGLRTPGEEIAFTARPKIKSQSQIYRYGRSIFYLPHRPNFSDDFDLCLHWVSVVRACGRSSEIRISLQFPNIQTALLENCWTSEKKWKRFQKVSSFNYEFCITCQDTREVLGHSWLSRSDL